MIVATPKKTPALSPTAKKEQSRNKVNDRRSNRKAAQPDDLNDPNDLDEGEELQTDLGPWAEAPQSTRVETYRYDYMNRRVQVTWKRGGHPYYYEIPYEVFRSFSRVSSKGKYINRVLNSYPYGPLDLDELAAPSNDRRRGVTSRSR